MKKGKEKRRKITKKGGKALKMHLFGLQTQKISSPRPPQTYFSGEKINLKRGPLIYAYCVLNFSLIGDSSYQHYFFLSIWREIPIKK